MSGCSAVWLAHLIWDQGVAGSNPVIPTTKFQIKYSMGYGQAVRQRVLAPLFVGSNPATPAMQNAKHENVLRFLYFIKYFKKQYSEQYSKNR